jgi:dihydrofolate synthase/folylpolyglutamate synthase
MEYLGNTLTAIAGEKAGILKPDVPAVTSRQEPEVLEVLEATARRLQAPLWVEGREFSITEEKPGAGLLYRGPSLTLAGLSLGLRGPHQRQNAAVALASLELLSRQWPVSPEAMREGLGRARWPGRFEELSEHPALVLDGAHNPAGIATLLAGLDALYPGRPVHAVFGVAADKDWRPMVRALFPRLTSAHLTPLPNPRSLPPAAYVDEARALCARVHTCADASEALAGARRLAGEQDVIVCTGSLFLVGQLRALLGADLGALRHGA